MNRTPLTLGTMLALLTCGLFALTVSARAAADETILITPSEHIMADQSAAIRQAREEIAAGNMGEAISELAQWVASHPDATDAARFLGDLYYRQGKFGLAETIYKQILGRNAGDKETHNRLGVVYATENRIDDAIREFNNALPGTDSIRDLVLAHLRKGDLAAYESQMLRAANDQPTDSDLQEEVGEIYEAIDQPAQAILYFRRSLDNDPESIAAINGLGMAYLDLHQYEQAENAFNQCLQEDPENYACLDNLGAAYLETKQYGRAQQTIDRAHHIAPERPEAVVNYGFLADAHGDWKRAIAFYVQAISLDPYVPESYINLGIDYEHHGLYPLAQAALLRGVAAAPYDGRIRFLLGRAYAAQGQTRLALEQLQAAQKSFDPDVAALAKNETTQLLNGHSENPQ